MQFYFTLLGLDTKAKKLSSFVKDNAVRGAGYVCFINNIIQEVSRFYSCMYCTGVFASNGKLL